MNEWFCCELLKLTLHSYSIVKRFNFISYPLMIHLYLSAYREHQPALQGQRAELDSQQQALEKAQEELVLER